MKLNTYRLSSLEDPTDEQLHALMEQTSDFLPRESDFVQMLPASLRKVLTRTMRRQLSTEHAS